MESRSLIHGFNGYLVHEDPISIWQFFGDSLEDYFITYKNFGIHEINIVEIMDLKGFDRHIANSLYGIHMMLLTFEDSLISE